jgi:integrase
VACACGFTGDRGAGPSAARDPPVQALHRLPAVLRRGRVLPDLHPGRRAGALPAEHVRLPAVPAESPTPGFTHLRFEALLTAARESPNPCGFALVAMLGLLGLRIFEAISADIADLGEEHGHRVLHVCGKGTKVVLLDARVGNLLTPPGQATPSSSTPADRSILVATLRKSLRCRGGKGRCRREAEDDGGR